MALSAHQKEQLFNQGHRDGMAGKFVEMSGEGATSYGAGHRMGKKDRDGIKGGIPDADAFESLAASTKKHAFEAELEHNHTLAAALIETRETIESEAVKLIDAMSLAVESKNETIQKLRDYKNTVVREVSEVSTALSRLKELTSDKTIKEQTAQLKEFLSVCEKLRELQASGFLSQIAATATRLSGETA